MYLKKREFQKSVFKIIINIFNQTLKNNYADNFCAATKFQIQIRKLVNVEATSSGSKPNLEREPFSDQVTLRLN